jgi:hypothetical protein
MNSPELIPFEQVIAALLDPDRPFFGISIYRLSDLPADEAARLAQIWHEIPRQRRLDLLADLEENALEDPLLFVEAIGRIGLGDADPQARAAAVRLAAIEENPDLLADFRRLAEHDEHYAVRAEAVSVLGNYVYLGEIDEIPKAAYLETRQLLLRLHQHDPQVIVRQRALEAIGFAALDEVNTLIEDAFTQDDEDWQITALIAMGRSANSRWKPQVSQMLDHDSEALRVEAVRAAGRLELEELKPAIFSLAANDPGKEVRRSALWSLSEIGGHEVQAFLEQLAEETEDEDELDYLEEVLDNLLENQMFSDDFLLFDFDEDTDDESDD